MRTACCETMTEHANARSGPIAVTIPDYPTPREFGTGGNRVCIREPSWYGEDILHAIDHCPWRGVAIRAEGEAVVPAT